ncbi:hypothetical protein RIF29_21595 [Crotalaria pallida]|uniref:Transmembrane protein n=1 Tax=Crotalaria pallida TaxID=3830 RepID=A0AAN9IDK0_CROPI
MWKVTRTKSEEDNEIIESYVKLEGEIKWRRKRTVVIHFLSFHPSSSPHIITFSLHSSLSLSSHFLFFSFPGIPYIFPRSKNSLFLLIPQSQSQSQSQSQIPNPMPNPTPIVAAATTTTITSLLLLPLLCHSVHTIIHSSSQ